MKKFGLALALSALLFSGVAFSVPKAVAAYAEDTEQISESVVSEESSESSSEQSAESASSSSIEPKYAYAIKDAYIGYRDSESSSYGEGDASIGSYFLSAYGWSEEEDSPVVMTIKGNIATKLESKIVYIYEYKPTMVKFAGEEVAANEDKTYTLERPAEKGEYNLEIYFTKTLVVNPMDLTSLNWSSLLTVQNLMTIGSWVVLFVGIVAMYFVNMHYKKRGSTSLEEVKSCLSKEIEERFGDTVAKQVNELLDVVIKKSYESIEKHLSTVDGNVATLVRCLLVMQENTPEARLAVTKYLSELQATNDDQAKQVKELIESEIKKYEETKEARNKALAEAEQKNSEWQKVAEEPDGGEDDGGFGSL